MKKILKRREFMAAASSTLLGAGLAAKAGFGQAAVLPESSRVIEVHHPRAVTGERRVDKDLVRQMVREGLSRLTGKKNPGRNS